MYTEHLQNVRLSWVLSGWLVAAALASLLLLALAGLGLTGSDVRTDLLWAAAVLGVAFWAGGFFIAFRAIEAPILHGIGIGLTSLVAWFLLNLLVELFFGLPDWARLNPTIAAALLLEQMAAAVAGAWVGHRIALRGGTELTEE